MSNKTTIWLLACTIAIFAVIGFGFLSSRETPEPTPRQTTSQQESQSLPIAELDARLLTETTRIQDVIVEKIPEVTDNYTIERARLYGDASWYGAILQYKGSDTLNRDTLRIVLKKKNDTWQLLTPNPQPLVNRVDIPNAPKGMLDDINKPAVLPGTPDSPQITPSE
jgi:hypothetical protein